MPGIMAAFMVKISDKWDLFIGSTAVQNTGCKITNCYSLLLGNLPNFRERVNSLIFSKCNLVETFKEISEFLMNEEIRKAYGMNIK